MMMKMVYKVVALLHIVGSFVVSAASPAEENQMVRNVDTNRNDENNRDLVRTMVILLTHLRTGPLRHRIVDEKSTWVPAQQIILSCFMIATSPSPVSSLAVICGLEW